MGILTTVFVLSFLVFFHELGHFLAARYLGVRVLVFSIGFGKAIFSKTIGNTKYVLAMIPLGGYVRMKGQDDLDPTQRNKDTDSYNSKSPIERMIILFAGPFANFLLAFLIYLFIGLGEVKYLAPSIGEVRKDSPASLVDIRKGDIVLSIDNEKIKTWNDLSSMIKKSNKEMIFLINRDDKIIKKILKATDIKYKTMFGDIESKKMVGISAKGDIVNIKHSISDTFSYAYMMVDNNIIMIYTSMEKMILGAISTENLGGIISIAQITSNASEIGYMAVLSLMALISVNLGVLNLLPIPALDGGHIMFNIYELITKHAPNEKTIIIITLLGWVMLLSLMFLGLYNDINRILN